MTGTAGAIGPGSRLADRYELVAPIANGGMAQVWRANDTVLGRPVAVKLLHSHLATDRAFLTRFRREARAAARLAHSSIVSIYDTVSTDGIEAIVMELVKGTTLRSALDAERVLTPKAAIELGIQVADGLDEAHRAGIVHRDIKPSNILLCADDRVVVTDFGIAKAGEDTDLTVTGTLLGTAKYLSPEQVRGDEVDPRSDLYSLGVVLFEALTGRPPFRADTDAATALARLRQDPPRIRHIDPTLPQDLDDLIHRLLAVDPADRFERALDVRAALSGVVLEPSGGDSTLLLASGTPSASSTPSSTTDDRTDETDWDDDGEDFGTFIASERSWLVPALVLTMVAGALVVAGLLLSRSPIADSVLPSDLARSDDETTTVTDDDVVAVDSTSLTDVEVVVEPIVAAVSTIDPDGDGTERADTAEFAIDGDPATYWRTESYRSADFAGLPKAGVGFVVGFEGRSRVSEVSLSTNSEGWSIEVFVGDSFDGGPGQWGEPVVTAADVSNDQTFDLGGAVGSRMLLWITDHGLSPDGDDDGEEPDHRFELRELVVS